MGQTTDGRVALPIPNGWFAIAWSRDLDAGGVKRIRYFNEELALFRTRSGEPKVLDAYCPHLGAHLAEGGRVIGETIRCPFHGWQFDGAGRCTHIPYCDRIPPRAQVRSWPVVERDCMIFVWHHAEGQPPNWEVPRMAELEDPEWTPPRHFDLEVPVHMQDMAENNCDPVHFQLVHGAPEVWPHTIALADNGRFMRVSSRMKRETPLGLLEIDLVRDTWGLGISSVRWQGIPGAGFLLFSSTSPIDEHRTYSRWLFTVTKNMADIAGEDFIDGMSTGVLQDIRIWRNKIHRAQPVLCAADTHLAEFRRWAKQFYSRPAADLVR
ncbi:MAG: aromatic ring-hydroxylating dioxygenase subunit alpha [Candidatus Binatia bacterium]